MNTVDVEDPSICMSIIYEDTWPVVFSTGHVIMVRLLTKNKFWREEKLAHVLKDLVWRIGKILI